MTSSSDIPRPDPLAGALAGLAAGLAASLAMDAFQAALSALSPSDGEPMPATQQFADRVARDVTGEPVADGYKALAGQAVHYGLGAALGVAYGLAAEYSPAVTAGRGAAFGAGTAALLDETAVPLIGVGDPPWKTSPATHLYTLASHLVFGAAAEATRRLVRGALGAARSRA